MTLAEAERLVKKISELLQQPAFGSQTPKLAQEYADLCRVVNHRLSQCAAMLDAGESIQALQLAETPPSVLDLATILGFRHADDWRAYCLANGHTAPDPLDERAIRQLNEVYNKGVSVQQPLYRDYRQAILLNQDQKALDVLRLIRKLNPQDTNAAREILRLEEKIAGAKLQNLEQALQAGNVSSILQIAQEIETQSLPIPSENEIWRKALLVRCKVLLQEAAALKEKGDWETAESILNRIQMLCQSSGLALDANMANDLALLQEWMVSQRQAFYMELNFQHALKELEHLLNRLDQRQIERQRPSQPELQADLETLAKKWQAVEKHNKPVAESIQSRLHKASHLLRLQINRRAKQKKKVIVVLTVLFAVASVIATSMLLRLHQANSFVSELSRLEAGRQVTAVEKSLAHIRSKGSGLMSLPAMQAAVFSAESFLQRELGLKTAFQQIMTELKRNESGNSEKASLEQIKLLLDTASQHAGLLAPDFQQEAQAELLAFQNRWERFLGELQKSRAAEFQELLQKAELLAESSLDYSLGYARVREALEQLAPIITRLEELASPGLSALEVQTILKSGLQALKSRKTTFDREAAQWEICQETMRNPASLEAYLSALRILQRSEFAAPALARAAGELLAANISLSALQASLLMPGKPDAWAFFSSHPETTFFPAEVMPAEWNKFIQLRDNQDIHTIVVYRLTVKAHDPERATSSHLIYARGSLGIDRFGRHEGQVYDPELSPERLGFAEQKYSSYGFALQQLGASAEAKTFERIGMKDLLDVSGGKFKRNLLSILDKLNQDSEASPLFLAFLTTRIYEIMDMQPWDWGCHLAPSLALHRARLVELGADKINSGDWMAPARIESFTPRLAEHFSQARNISYIKQANFFHALLSRACKTGFAFAGFVDANAGIVPASPAVQNGELWGLDNRQKSVVLLFKRTHQKADLQKLREPLRFTPLFVFQADRAKLLQDIAKIQSLSSDDNIIKPYLPPLFAEPYE